MGRSVPSFLENDGEKNPDLNCAAVLILHILHLHNGNDNKDEYKEVYKDEKNKDINIG